MRAINELRTGWVLAVLLLAALTGSVSAAAEDTGWGYELSDELMSPYCPGRALSECPSPQAADLRKWILDQEKAGVARETVEQELFAQFGDGLRQSPRAEGVGLVAYAIPAAVFVLGGVFVVWFLGRQRGALGAESVVAPDDSRAPDLALQVDQDVAREVDEDLARL